MARSKALVPEAKAGLNRLKFETATEVGVTLTDGYNGNIKASDAGKVGGTMVRKLIQHAEQNITRTF